MELVRFGGLKLRKSSQPASGCATIFNRPNWTPPRQPVAELGRWGLPYGEADDYCRSKDLQDAGHSIADGSSGIKGRTLKVLFFVVIAHCILSKILN